MKTWIKGGLIGGFTGIILTIIFFTTRFSFSYVGYLVYPFFLLSFSVALVFCGETAKSCPGAIISFAVSCILGYFLLGSLIGFLIGKFRDKE